MAGILESILPSFLQSLQSPAVIPVSRELPIRPRQEVSVIEKLLRAVILAVACLSLLATHAHGQVLDAGQWQGGHGHFTNARPWLCTGPEFLIPSPCLPNGRQFVGT